MTSRRRWLLAAVPLCLGLAWREAPPLAVFVASLVPLVGLTSEGKSNWFEGCLLLGVYVILAIGFYHLPD